MTSERDTPSTVLRTVLLPALDQLFTPDEIEAIAVWRTGDAPDTQPPLPAQAPSSRWRPPPAGGIYALVRIHGEEFTDLIVDNAAAAAQQDLVDRLVANLEDFIAESRFGWGTRRARRSTEPPE